MLANLPLGTVTFLFTDIEGSTQLWEKHPEVMKAALADHDSILRQAVESHDGHIIKTTGDGVHAVFGTALEAVQATLSAQREFQARAPGAPIQVRMGLHTGEAEFRDGDYYGQALNRAARIMSVGHGGQILLSAVSADLIREQLPENVTLLDLGEHRLKDLVRAERLHQVCAPDLRREFPALKSLNTLPNNLPIQLTSFIGREREMDEAKARLAAARLLTLIGPGGTGKTRLSLQIAADLLPAFADGAWTVELAAVTDPALILQATALVFGVREQPGMALGELVTNYLRTKQLLLILDNCEHLVEACARLADQLLHACPQLKIIVSSREALGIHGEAVYRVPSLSLPDPASLTIEALGHSESIQLFMERATAANPKFLLTEKNAPAVVQICRRLDGIPLALELAAARLGVFSAEQIAARLDDRFKLLTGGSRTALPRQQTLRALIDWSYDVLGLDERALLRRLSVFAGGWTFEAAEYLGSELDVLSLLTQLVNKSLITVDDEGEEPRYRLLETIRQYARDKLLEAGESQAMRDRHRDYFVKLSEAAEDELVGSKAFGWVTWLEAEYDNLRTAIEWGMETSVMDVLRIGGALPNFWYRRGYETEARRWIAEALQRAERLPPADGEAAGRLRQTIVAKAWQSVAFMAFSQGDNLQAEQAAKNCVRLAREIGDQRMLATMLVYEAVTLMMAGAFEGIDTLTAESLAVARNTDDKFIMGMALSLIGSRMLASGGDVETARGHMREGLALLKESGNYFGTIMSLFSMSMAARFQGRFDEARLQLTALLPRFLEIGDKHRANMVRSELAHMERDEGHLEQASQMYRLTIVEWQKLGHRAAVAHQLECFAFLARVKAQPERAARLFGAAEALREKINIQMTGPEHIEYERALAALRSGLDEPTFKGAWADGRAMTLEQAVGYALQ